jgi:hypothetical protein
MDEAAPHHRVVRPQERTGRPVIGPHDQEVVSGGVVSLTDDECPGPVDGDFERPDGAARKLEVVVPKKAPVMRVGCAHVEARLAQGVFRPSDRDHFPPSSSHVGGAIVVRGEVENVLPEKVPCGPSEPGEEQGAEQSHHSRGKHRSRCAAWKEIWYRHGHLLVSCW